MSRIDKIEHRASVLENAAGFSPEVYASTKWTQDDLRVTAADLRALLAVARAAEACRKLAVLSDNEWFQRYFEMTDALKALDAKEADDEITTTTD